MREQFILAQGLDWTEFTRSLALHDRPCIGLKICSSVALAREALMRSGILVSEDFIDREQELELISQAVSSLIADGDRYFGENPTGSDIERIAKAIRTLRMLVAEGDESAVLHDTLAKGSFTAKNTALLGIYDRYMELVRSACAIDSVAFVRRAAEQCTPVDADFTTLAEFPPLPLEQALVERLSVGTSARKTVADLFGVTSEKPKVAAYRNCFGAPNEVEVILEDAYAKKLDTCTVAVTDTKTYSQLFFDAALLYNIPMTFGCGVPITNSYPAQLLSLYNRWTTSGSFGASAIRNMLTCDAFDKAKLDIVLEERGALTGFDKDNPFNRYSLYDYLGSIRFENGAATNEERFRNYERAASEDLALVEQYSSKQRDIDNARRKVLYLGCMKVVGEELALPVEEFIAKYARCRVRDETSAEKLAKALDAAARPAIHDGLAAMRAMGAAKPELLALSVLGRMVLRQRSTPGCLHITGISGAFSTMRENLYVAGVSATKFPGRTREDPLLLDEDIELFGAEALPFTSDEKTLRKSGQLLSLARLAAGLSVACSVSYAGMDVSELKKDNASAVILKLYEEEHGNSITPKVFEEEVAKPVGYFEPAISPSRLIGNAYIKGQEILQASPATPSSSPQPTSTSWDTSRAFSPSTLADFFTCPRKYLLKHLLRISEPEEESINEIISALERGSLAHALMERLGKSPMDKAEFLKLSGEYFDRFIDGKPPLLKSNVLGERMDFLDMMAAAYDADPGQPIALQEEELSFAHPSGITLRGFPDRVEKLGNSDCVIVDFKSGRNVTHVEDDFNTCFQGMVYAYLLEQAKGEKVDHAEFRYLRDGTTVKCRYDDTMKDLLAARMACFKEHMDKGEFPVSQYAGNPQPGHPDPCKDSNCKYGDICGKKGGTV